MLRVREHLSDDAHEALHHFGVGEIGFRVDADTQQHFQPGFLHDSQLFLGELRPGANGIETGRLDDRDIAPHPLGLRPALHVRVLPRPGANLVPERIDEELLAVDVVPAIFEFDTTLGVVPRRLRSDSAQSAKQHKRD